MASGAFFPNALRKPTVWRPTNDSPRNRAQSTAKQQGPVMSDEERYLFDLQGYLVVRNALPGQTVADLLRL